MHPVWFAAPLVLLLVSGCASPPQPLEPEDSAGASRPDPGAAWRVDRWFNFTIVRGQHVPVTGSTHTEYDGLKLNCYLFSLPAVDRLTIWVNSTTGASPSMGEATFWHRTGTDIPPPPADRPERVGPASYRLILEDLPEAEHQVNYHADFIAVDVKVEGHIIVEGHSRYALGILPNCETVDDEAADALRFVDEAAPTSS